METRVAVMSIIVEESSSTEMINSILSRYSEYIVGRLGLPYRKRGVAVISVVLDAPQNITATVSGKIGNLPGVSTKTAYSGVIAYD